MTPSTLLRNLEPLTHAGRVRHVIAFSQNERQARLGRYRQATLPLVAGAAGFTFPPQSGEAV